MITAGLLVSGCSGDDVAAIGVCAGVERGPHRGGAEPALESGQFTGDVAGTGSGGVEGGLDVVASPTGQGGVVEGPGVISSRVPARAKAFAWSCLRRSRGSIPAHARAVTSR